MKQIPVRHIQEPQLTGNFTIRRLQDVLRGKDMAQPLHRHAYYFILLVEKATGTHAIDFVSHKVSNSSVFLLRPGQVHELTLKANSTGYLIEFNPDLYPSRNSKPYYTPASRNHSGAFHPGVGTYKRLHTVATSIWREYSDKEEGYIEIIQANLGIFFIELGRLAHKNTGTQAYDYTQQRLDELSGLIEKHITTHKSVSWYADTMNLSPYQLNAITKTTVGKTCSAVIDEYIILESKRQLLATTNTISQVAEQMGYDDVSYFIRFFKKHTGSPPEAFRDKFR